jgi:predicted dehydrogenase
MAEVHAHAVRANGGVLSEIAGRTPDSARAASGRLHALKAAESPESLIDSDNVDVVHICIPNAGHAYLARRALEAGKHVVCEKPLATTLEDAEQLSALADRSHSVAAVPFVYRFYPTIREARARLTRGEAGNLWLLHGSYLQDWLASSAATNWRVDPASGGASRAFGDIGVHWCDLMEFTTGHRITRLVSTTSRAFPQRVSEGGMADVETEDGATLLFETDKGATGSLVVSQVSPGRKNRLWFSFDGTEASFSFNQEQPDILWIENARGSTRLPSGPDTLSSRESQRHARLPAGHPQGYQDSFNAFVGDVFAAARGEYVDGLPTFRDGLRAAQITRAVVDSAAASSWVEVPGLNTRSTFSNELTLEKQR